MTEIIDILRALGRGWWFVVVVAIAAAALAVVTAPDLTTYRTEAVIGVDPTTDAANARIDFVRNLQVAAESPAVLQRLADEVDRDVADLRRGLDVSRVEDSQLTEIVYEEDVSDPETATAVVTGFLPAAEPLLAGPEQEAELLAERLAELEEETSAALADAQEAVEAAITDNDGLPPDDELDALRQRAASLRADRLAAQAVDDEELDAQLAAEQRSIEEAVQEALGGARAFDRVVVERDRQAELLRDIRSRQLQARLDAVVGELPVTVEVVRVAAEQAPTVELARRALSAALLGGLVALVVLTLWLRWRTGRSTVERARQGGGPGRGARQDGETDVDREVGVDSATRGRTEHSSAR